MRARVPAHDTADDTVVIFNDSCSVRIGRRIDDKFNTRLLCAYGVSKCLTIFWPSVDKAYGIYRPLTIVQTNRLDKLYDDCRCLYLSQPFDRTQERISRKIADEVNDRRRTMW